MDKKATQKEKVFAAISYLFGPAPVLSQLICILILITNKKNRFIKYHAFQSLIIFSFLQFIIMLLFYISYNLLWLIPFIILAEIFGLWPLFLWKSTRGETFKVVLVGNFVNTKLLPVKKTR